MKKLYGWMFFVLLLCVLGTVLFLLLAPAQVPMHYNFAGEVDRIGSKYEDLLFPGITLVLGAVFTLLARKEGKKQENTNEKAISDGFR